MISSMSPFFPGKSTSKKHKNSSPITDAEKSLKTKPSNVRKNPCVRAMGEAIYSNRDKTGDITFQIQGEEIKAHKCVLAALSPKYMAELYSDFEEAKKATFPVKDVSAAAFEEFLQFFYLDRVTLTHENIGDVLTLTAQSSEKFFDECIQFLTDSQSIDNVCQMYHLAVMHNIDDLIGCCELKISNHSKEVFQTDGFLCCTPGDLFNILQSGYLNCKEVNVFEACIKWAKHNCTETDSNKVENLRKILTGDDVREGKLLHQIRFGAMTIEEFMKIYSNYKDLFTENEREEILFMIGKISDLIPKWFNDEPRDIPYRKWDPEECVQGDRVVTADTESEVFRLDANKTLLSTDRPILLGGFDCGSLLEKKGPARSGNTACEMCVTSNILIIRKYRLLDKYGKTLLSTTEKLTFKTNHQTYVNFKRPIVLRPNFFYEIQLVFKEGISLKKENLKNELVLGRRLDLIAPSISTQSSLLGGSTFHGSQPSRPIFGSTFGPASQPFFPVQTNFVPELRTVITFHSCLSEPDLVTSLKFGPLLEKK